MGVAISNRASGSARDATSSTSHPHNTFGDCAFCGYDFVDVYVTTYQLVVCAMGGAELSALVASPDWIWGA
jgi:hypothetical protein